MAKGLSEIIASLMMIVITVGLASVAYAYITGLFTVQTTGMIDLAAASCNPSTGTYYFVIKNMDRFNRIEISDMIVSIDNVFVTPDVEWYDQDGNPDLEYIGANATVIAIISPAGEAGSLHRIKVLGPSGRPLQLTVSC